MKLRLIVKGKAEMAAEAARAHGMEVEEVVSESESNQSTGLRVEGDISKAAEWLNEDDDFDPPYPTGSLLWFGYENKETV